MQAAARDRNVLAIRLEDEGLVRGRVQPNAHNALLMHNNTTHCSVHLGNAPQRVGILHRAALATFAVPSREQQKQPDLDASGGQSLPVSPRVFTESVRPRCQLSAPVAAGSATRRPMPVIRPVPLVSATLSFAPNTAGTLWRSQDPRHDWGLRCKDSARTTPGEPINAILLAGAPSPASVSRALPPGGPIRTCQCSSAQ